MSEADDEDRQPDEQAVLDRDPVGNARNDRPSRQQAGLAAYTWVTRENSTAW